MRVKLLVVFFLLTSLISWGSPPTLQEWTDLRLDFQIALMLLKEGSLSWNESIKNANELIAILNNNLLNAKLTQEDSNEIITNLNNNLSEARIVEQSLRGFSADSQKETKELSKDLKDSNSLNKSLQDSLSDYKSDVIKEAEKMAKKQKWDKIIIGGLIVLCVGEAIGIGLMLLSR